MKIKLKNDDLLEFKTDHFKFQKFCVALERVNAKYFDFDGVNIDPNEIESIILEVF